MSMYRKIKSAYGKRVKKRFHMPEIGINGVKLVSGHSDKVSVAKQEYKIKLYGEKYNLPRNEFRLVSTHRWQGHLAYKVYNKLRCYYQLYSPFFGEFVECKI